MGAEINSSQETGACVHAPRPEALLQNMLPCMVADKADLPMMDGKMHLIAGVTNPAETQEQWE